MNIQDFWRFKISGDSRFLKIEDFWRFVMMGAKRAFTSFFIRDIIGDRKSSDIIGDACTIIEEKIDQERQNEDYGK